MTIAKKPSRLACGYTNPRLRLWLITTGSAVICGKLMVLGKWKIFRSELLTHLGGRPIDFAQISSRNRDYEKSESDRSRSLTGAEGKDRSGSDNTRSRIAEELTLKKNAIPAFKGYSVSGRVFPRCLCASINEEIVHGIPSNRTLKEGDIIGLDYGVIYEGFYGDSAITVGVGRVSEEAKRLMEITERSLYDGINQLYEGKRLGDLGAAVQMTAEGAGYSVVRAFVGHGIGKRLHEEPPVPNYGEPDRGLRFKEGMVLAIEPMVNIGGPEVEIKADGWTAVTKDGSLAAHFEHSVAVTKDGPYILSQL
jgi:methionyl aminopeptidase